MSRAVESSAGRVEGAQLGRVLGPAQGRERPQRRAEPGVEHVLVATQLALAGAAAAGVGLGDVGLLAGVAVVDRQPVAPPELAADAPGPDALHPVEVDALPALRVDPHAVVADDLDRGLGELVHRAEPLQRDQRLDPLARAVRERDRVRVLLLAGDPALLAQLGDDRLLRLGRAHPHERSRSRLDDPPVGADHRDLLEPVRAADLEVVGIVARGDLQGAGPELGIDVGVGDDRQPAADQRQLAEAADQVPVAIVVGVDRDGACRRASSRAGRWPRSAPGRSPRRDSRSSTGCRSPRGSRPRGR